MKDQTIVTLVAMACVTAIALVYDGQLALVAVGALIGILTPSPFGAKVPDGKEPGA